MTAADINFNSSLQPATKVVKVFPKLDDYFHFFNYGFSVVSPKDSGVWLYAAQSRGGLLEFDFAHNEAYNASEAHHT